MTKGDVARLLEQIATCMELKGESTFKVSTYRKAVQNLKLDERPLNETSDIAELEGIGKGVTEVINDYRETGESQYSQQLQEEVPEGLIPLLKIQRFGSKRIAKLCKELNIVDKASLQVAYENERVSELSKFVKKTEQNILEAVKQLGAKRDRYPIDQMKRLNREIIDYIDTLNYIGQYSSAGGFRRFKGMSKDSDLIISTDNPKAVQQQSLSIPNKVKEVAVRNTEVSLELAYDDETIGVDFRLIEPSAFYHTLQHFIGSREHDIRIRRLARARNEKASKYGVEQVDGTLVQYDSEAKIYEYFNVNFIPPAMREDGSEFDKDLSNIITIDDISGDIHMHITYNDGAFSIRNVVEANITEDYKLIVITNHSQSLRIANGLQVEKLLRQNERIRALDKEYSEIGIYSGTGMDILPNGSLDYDDEILAQLDYVVGVIRRGFNQSGEQVMERLVNACHSPHVRHIAHPTGRIIGRRDGYRPYIERLVALAEKTNTVLKVNTNPHRLDLSADVARKYPNVRLTVGTDAHYTDHLDFMNYGIATAQEGFITKDRMINALSREAFKDFIRDNTELKK